MNRFLLYARRRILPPELFYFSSVISDSRCPEIDRKADEKLQKKKFRNFRDLKACLSRDKQEGMKPSGKRGKDMSDKTKEKSRSPGGCEEELIDVLIAISVVAKRLAAKLKTEYENMEEIKDE